MAWKLSVLALAATASAQDSQQCEEYNVSTGLGTCGGIAVNVGPVICANGFDVSKCFAAMANPDGSGGTEAYYFKGTPTGLPAGTAIQSDCNSGDFPAGGGVAMAQVFKDASGNPSGCYPAADVQGTVLDYATNADGSLASLTVNFNVHTDSTGTERDGFIQITCQKGGPTSDFQYSTVGDQGHQSQYEVDTTADCTAIGPPPPTPPGAGPVGYWCVKNTSCLYGPQPDPTFKGGTQAQCQALCKPPLYKCDQNQCVLSADGGGTLDECKQICG